MDPKLNNYIQNSDWERVRAVLLHDFQPQAYVNLETTPLQAALTNPSTPIDIIQKLLHPCLLNKKRNPFAKHRPTMHQAAFVGRRDVIQVLKNANVDLTEERYGTGQDGCELAAMLYIQQHHKHVDQEAFSALIPNSPMNLTLLFVDVISHFLQLNPLNLESARWVISQFLFKLPTTTVWRSLWLFDRGTYEGVRYVKLQIQPIGVPRGFLATSIEIPFTRLSLLLDILLLCGFTAQYVLTQDYNREMLETFKTKSQEKYRDTSKKGLENISLDFVRRSLCLPVTSDHLKSLELPGLLIREKLSREDIMDVVMYKLQQ